MSYDDDEADVEIGVGAAYGNAWRQVWSHFLLLFVVGIIFWVAESIAQSYDHGWGWNNWDDPEGFGVFDAVRIVTAVQMSIFAALFSIFVVNPLSYGRSFVYLKAARNERASVGDMFEPFRDYLNVVVAAFVVGVITTLGFLFLIIPGIIFSCKLAFVPFIVVDKKMSAMDAIKESWDMTRGYAFMVFLIGLLSIPIVMLGFMCFIVGLIPALMIIKLAFASLYHAVDTAEYVRYPDEDSLYD
jgi:uncharacterized membrane protein